MTIKEYHRLDSVEHRVPASIGSLFMELELYRKGLQYYDEAVSKAPLDKKTLLGRAWARAKAFKFRAALDDSNKTLALDPTNISALSQKALLSYLCGEIEDAMIQNIRMLKRRIKPDNFYLGILHCRDAILNSVGPLGGRPLRDHFKIIRKLAWRKSIDLHKPFIPKVTYKKKKKVVETDTHQPAVPDRKLKSYYDFPKNKPEIPKLITEQEALLPILDHTKGVKPLLIQPPIPKQEPVVGKSLPIVSPLSENNTAPVKLPPISGSCAVPQLDTIEEVLEEEPSSILDSLKSEGTKLDIKIPKAGPYPYKPLQARTTNIENYMAEHYLRRMYIDKAFLKDIPNHRGVSVPNKKGSECIVTLAKQGYKNVNLIQEIMRRNKPFYCIKYQNSKATGTLKARQLRILKEQQMNSNHHAQKLIRQMEVALQYGELFNILRLAEKLKLFCEDSLKEILPLRQEYLIRMYNLICDGFYNTKRYSTNMTEIDKINRVYVVLGLSMSKDPSHDELVKQFKFQVVDFRKEVAVFEARVRRAYCLEEVLWLYHELARFNVELKEYEMGKVYARKCITIANSIQSYKWSVNAYMLIIRVCNILRNRNDTLEELGNILTVAEKLADKQLSEFLNDCLWVIQNNPFEQIPQSKLLDMRQSKMVDLMHNRKMKAQAAHLFRKISAAPPRRRMTVIPGVIVEGFHEAAEKKKGDDTGKDKYARRGTEFMELIQYHIGE